MSVKGAAIGLKIFGVVVAGLIFLALGAGVFVRPEHTLTILTLLNSPLIVVAMLGALPFAVVLAVGTGVLTIFSFKAVPATHYMPVALNVALAASVIVLFSIKEKSTGLFRRKMKWEREDLAERAKLIEKEISFYEEKHAVLSQRGEQRRKLSQAARELGALLEPGAIQGKLLGIAKELFPTDPVKLSLGDQADPVDNYIIQKPQPLLLQEGGHKENPFMAAPISFQRSVAGILRVGGAPRKLFSKEEFRLLEILANLASMALDNSFLFNQVKETALRDGLTGLLTHRAFNVQLEAQILEASRYNQPLSLILADLDHFKSVNDTFGHQAGDQILQGFAHVLVRNVRDVDVVARYGGEEFILLLLQLSLEDAVRTAEQIRQDLAALKFVVPSKDGGSREITVTGSFGAASFPVDATSGQQLVRVADQRLYQAKRDGRNKVVGE